MPKSSKRSSVRVRANQTSRNRNRRRSVPRTFAALDPIRSPEIIFGLVAPIGTDLKLVERVLGNCLKEIKYDPVFIHVTDFLKELKSFKLIENPAEKRYESYINTGNKLRQKLGRLDAFSLMSLAAIRRSREQRTGSRNIPAYGTAYILNQFKRPEEIATLRAIYGPSFVQISAYCSEDSRRKILMHRIAQSHHRNKPTEKFRPIAEQLMLRDAEEEDEPSGQRMRDTFHLADVVIDAETEQSAMLTCERFIRAFFGDFFVTPTKDEYGSFLARSAALRSADLSRQVGAAIVDNFGSLIAVGCNEVPKSGGGMYWEGDDPDMRDHSLGYDPGAYIRREALHDILRRLKRSEWLRSSKTDREIEELVDKAAKGHPDSIMRDSTIMNVIEFGRAVHAEMAAITDAAMRGVSVKGAVLYTTTFPCHLCARHIVSSGIKKVVFIEPYAKSLALELYDDAICLGSTINGSHVEFSPFIGIAPNRYIEVFAKGRRKSDDGRAEKWSPHKAVPIFRITAPSYIQVETKILSSLTKLMKSRGI